MHLRPPQVNCLTEIFFDEGLARAAELDRILAETGKPVGPLHGLPISLKDNFRVKGGSDNIADKIRADRLHRPLVVDTPPILIASQCTRHR